MKKEFILISVFCLNLFGNTVFALKTKDRVVTIYNQNIAFVKEKRNFRIKTNGFHKIIYEGIANSVVADSIIPKFSDKRLRLYTQIFKKNVVDFNSLILYYQKNNLLVNFFQPTINKNKRIVKKGYILSRNGSMITLQESKSKNIFEVNLSDIFFDSLPNELKIEKPALIWRVKGYKGKQKVDISYLTRGLSWKVDYALELDKKASLKGWIAIENHSGTSYKNSTIFCVAGDIATMQSRKNYAQLLYKKVAANGVYQENIKQESFVGYHIYKVPFQEDIQKGLTQILFIDKKNIDYKSYAQMNFSIPLYPVKNAKQTSLFHIVEIKNTKENSLGIPLPKGMVRVYAKNSLKNIYFEGQDVISQTPTNQNLKLNVGKFFDITSKITQVKFNFSKNRQHIYSKIKIELKNEDIKERKILLICDYPVKGNYKISSDCNGKCKQKNLSGGKTLYTIDMKSKEKYIFFVEYRVND